MEAGDKAVPASVTEGDLEALAGFRWDSRKPSRKNISYCLKVGGDPRPARPEGGRRRSSAGRRQTLWTVPIKLEHVPKPKLRLLESKSSCSVLGIGGGGCVGRESDSPE